MKFNLTLESIVKQQDNMRMVKLKEIWKVDDMNLIKQSNNISDEEFHTYWDAIDTAIKFNITKRKEFISKESAKAWQAAKKFDKVHQGNEHREHHEKQDSRDPMYDLFKKRRNFDVCSKDKYHWSREPARDNTETRQFFLPRLPRPQSED